MSQLYILDLSIFLKKKQLNREGDIIGLLEVIVQGSCLMEKYASRKALGLAREIIYPTSRCTIVNKFIVIVLKCIMTPSFVTQNSASTISIGSEHFSEK